MNSLRYFLTILILITTIGCSDKEPEFIADQSREKQSERMELIESLAAEGVFPNITFADNGALIWVGPAFDALDGAAKIEYVKEIHAYAYRKEKGLFTAKLRNKKTGAAVGEYHPDTGLTLN